MSSAISGGERLATEVGALRRGLGVVVRRDLALLTLCGRDAAGFLHRVLSADVQAMGDGEGRPAALLTVKGRVVAALEVVRESSERFLALLERDFCEAAREALERYVVVDDVEVARPEGVVIGAYGPDLPRHPRLAVVAQELAPLHLDRIEFGGEPLLVIGDDTLGVPGVLLASSSGDPHLAIRLAEELAAEAGGAASVVGMAAYEVARIEAGQPRMGRELDEEVLLLEAGQMARVSFEKGCFIGQEPVCRLRRRGQLQRRLVGLRFLGGALPEPGEMLSSADRDDAGRVTSAAYSPSVGAAIGMGYVRRAVAAVGTRLQRAGVGEAEVVALPHLELPRRPMACPEYW